MRARLAMMIGMTGMIALCVLPITWGGTRGTWRGLVEDYHEEKAHARAVLTRMRELREERYQPSDSELQHIVLNLDRLCRDIQDLYRPEIGVLDRNRIYVTGVACRTLRHVLEMEVYYWMQPAPRDRLLLDMEEYYTEAWRLADRAAFPNGPT